jgi:hypothetical protein
MVRCGDPGSDCGLGGCGSGATANQNHKCDFSVHVSVLSRISHRPNSPPRATLYTVDSRSYPHPDCSELCSRAQVPCTPVVADSGRAAYTARLFHFSEWICISQNFNDRRPCGQKREPRRDGCGLISARIVGGYCRRSPPGRSMRPPTWRRLRSQ